jgi:hypothetical protein
MRSDRMNGPGLKFSGGAAVVGWFHAVRHEALADNLISFRFVYR